MTAPHDPQPPAPTTLTWAGCREGMRHAVPLLPAVCVFAATFGTAAAERGLSLWETLALSAFVYAGTSQLVALQIWQDVWTPATLATLIAIVGTVNARMVLMGASLQPWLRHAPASTGAACLFFLTDLSWLTAAQYHARGGRDLGMLLGTGVFVWFFWIAFAIPGHVAGSLVDAKTFGIDLVLPVYFAIMLVPLWPGARGALPWAVALVVALAVEHLAGGYVHIVAGALAGALSAALLPAERRQEEKRHA